VLQCCVFAIATSHGPLFAADPNQPVTTDTQTQHEAESESRPLRTTVADYSERREKENVARLLDILANHQSELLESQRPTRNIEDEMRREATLRDAAELAHIPYSPDKIRLNGAEGSTALARVSERLNDQKIPQSRRNITRICSVKTRQNGTLLSSGNHSLRPVGKNNYIAMINIQPGDTSIEIGVDRWDVKLPKDMGSNNFILTLYVPPKGKPEFHIFSVPDLLAQDKPYLPAWLPSDFKLTPPAG